MMRLYRFAGSVEVAGTTYYAQTVTNREPSSEQWAAAYRTVIVRKLGQYAGRPINEEDVTWRCEWFEAPEMVP